jgi:DNA-binding NarL/FixJ family response regulator
MKRKNNKSSKPASYREAKTLLTPRQLQIIYLVRRGLTNPQIAEILSISEGTVKKHRKNICTKLGVSGTNGLLLWSIKEIPKSDGWDRIA